METYNQATTEPERRFTPSPASESLQPPDTPSPTKSTRKRKSPAHLDIKPPAKKLAPSSRNGGTGNGGNGNGGIGNGVNGNGGNGNGGNGNGGIGNGGIGNGNGRDSCNGSVGAVQQQQHVHNGMRDYAPQVEKALDKTGSWTDASKQALMDMCEHFNPQGSMDWSVRAPSPFGQNLFWMTRSHK